MKQKVSISIDEKTLKEVDKRLISATFRNRSHFVEYAVKKMLGEEG
jgi:metal-responsive CopG/Arc/MetJ family transcriptional regulator